MKYAAMAFRRWPALLLCAAAGSGFAAEADLKIAPYPLFLSTAIKPNLMVIFDNSQSMDATMGGKVISGDIVDTRGNIARTVLRSIIASNRNSFNWGLTTFETKADTFYNTQAYYLGNASTMVYTNTCVNDLSNVPGADGNPLRCISLPAYLNNNNGFNFITYEKSGDDPDVNDVFYTNDTPLRPYGVGVSSVRFDLYQTRDNTIGWGDFSGSMRGVEFVPTDAGFWPNGNTFKRGLFLTRGWGYLGEITGDGKIVEPVQADSGDHFDRLTRLLGNEWNGDTPEIKNSALFTPLAGSLQTVQEYFRGDSAAGKSPISEICQTSNYVVLATDGNPTGKTDGTQYDPSQWQNTRNADNTTWTFGQAQKDVFAQITALLGTKLTGPNLSNPALAGKAFPIKTYVIGMGDTLDNASSVAALHEMARLGEANPSPLPAFLGRTAAELENAFQTIVRNVTASAGAATSVALNTGTLSANSAVYQAKFDSTDWTGDLLALSVSATGAVEAAADANWRAAAMVKAQNWDTGRNILTYKPLAALGQRGIKFRWPTNPATPTGTELDKEESTALNPDSFGAARLAYLRGDDSKEVRKCTSPPCAPMFRNRPLTPLGDIVNSAPNYVAAPAFGYFDDFEAAPYSDFVTTYRGRTKVVYVGANDGMLHAFNADTGEELFAYVPAALYSALPQLSSPAYVHRFYADGSPTVGDVFYAGAWHTMLVAGMRAGAKGIYALDVTNPANFSEANAARVVRWEFRSEDDADMGYVFGQPLLVKTNNGRWSVIVSGGYNAGGSGKAVLFIIDAETGGLVRKLDTLAGTALSPNGLSSPAAIDSTGDGIVDLVYAGDLDGNLWKFDLLSASEGSWAVGNGGLALFKTPGGSTQPITARLDVTRFPPGGFLVAFGTGRYFAEGDQLSTSAQGVYAILDSGVNGTVVLTDLQQQSIVKTATTSDGVEYRLSTHAVGPPGDNKVTGDTQIATLALYLAGKKGWYLNLPTPGERVVTDARFRSGRLILASMIPDTASACSFGGTGWLLEFDAITGNRLDSPTFDVNNDKALNPANDYVAFYPSTTNNVSGRKIGGIPATPGVMAGDKVDYRFVNKADGTVETVIAGPGTGGAGRAMWREVR